MKYTNKVMIEKRKSYQFSQKMINSSYSSLPAYKISCRLYFQNVEGTIDCTTFVQKISQKPPENIVDYLL